MQLHRNLMDSLHGIKPKEFREIAHEEISKYPYVTYAKREVASVIKNTPFFELVTSDNE